MTRFLLAANALLLAGLLGALLWLATTGPSLSSSGRSERGRNPPSAGIESPQESGQDQDSARAAARASADRESHEKASDVTPPNRQSSAEGADSRRASDDHEQAEEGPVGALVDLGQSAVQAADEAARETFELSPAERRKLGKEVNEAVREKYSVVEDPATLGRLRRLARPVLRHHDEDPDDYRFTVLDKELVNAFAHVGGHIYVTSGLLRALEGDPELQFVVAHEAGHLVLGHSAEKVAYAGKARRWLGEASIAIQALSNVIAAGYSEEKEFAADEFAAKTILALDRRKSTAVSALRQVEEAWEDNRPATRPWKGRDNLLARVLQEVDNHLRTHPPTEKRIRKIQQIERE